MTDIPLNWFFRLLTFQWDYKAKITTENSIQCGSEIVEYASITKKPKLDKGFFWSNIVFPSSATRKFKISGVNNKDAQFIFDSIINGIQEFHQKEFSPYYNLIPESYQNFKSYFNGKYVKHSFIENWKSKNADLTQRIDNEFVLQSLPGEERKKVERYLNLVSQSHSIRENENHKFTINELKKYKEFFDTVENNPLTESQRLACVVNEDNNLVLAGAGSGKTSVIIAKTGYLIQSGLPGQKIILLYFMMLSSNQFLYKRLQRTGGCTNLMSSLQKAWNQFLLTMEIVLSAKRVKSRCGLWQMVNSFLVVAIIRFALVHYALVMLAIKLP